jgi:hypothetical protein
VKLVLALLLSLFAPAVFAQSGGQAGGGAVQLTNSGGVGNGLLIGLHGTFYSDTSSLGGDTLDNGSSLFTRFDAQYNLNDYFCGFGLFYETDKFGAEENDIVEGIQIEATLGSLFLKIMPGTITQGFSNRSFSKRTGSFQAFELGLRANLLEGVFFYEVALQHRSETITSEDSRTMSDKFSKTSTFPLLGVGITI